ncbi:response regulator transcription factor [Haloarcula litorea]|uniref:response regulator transcription factor n=1 Tax=Haloarcula litorea TaxID=3032579 RepID=UPI0023E7B352|nr:response regulator [Halomicroarcula sp. GDY20]
MTDETSAHVLVVDDDETIRRLLTHRLENAGFTVTTYPDGRAAADALDAGDVDPDLCLLDVMMPRLNGTRLLRMIRNGELAVDPALPVVMLTSRGRESDVLEGFESGADDYVTKPFSGAALVARVTRYVDD